MSRQISPRNLQVNTASGSRVNRARSRAERSQRKSERFEARRTLLQRKRLDERQRHWNAFRRAGSAFRHWWLMLSGLMMNVVRPIVGKQGRGFSAQRGVRSKAMHMRSDAVLMPGRSEELESKLLLAAVIDAEPNDTFATPQFIPGASFDTVFSADIGNGAGANTSTLIPHAEVSGTGDGSVDYFSISATAGDIGIFDIDYGWFPTAGTPGQFHSELAVWDSAGTLLATNTDSSVFAGAGGSADVHDSFIELTFPTTGTYIVGVAEFSSTAGSSGFSSANPIDAAGSDTDPFGPFGDGDTYTLNISVGAPPSGTVSVVANDTFGEEVLSGGTPNNGQFTITATTAPASDLVVSYTVTGTATAGSDYTALTGVATIPAGLTTAVVDVSVLDDFVYEGVNETVILTLTGATLGYLVDATPDTVDIGDNEAAPTISVAATTDGAEGSTDGLFTFTMTGPSDTDTVVDYTIAGTATAGADYTALSGSVTILAGATTATVLVPVIDDMIVEPDETVELTITTITGAPGITGSGSATVTITDADDDTTVKIAAGVTGEEDSTFVNGPGGTPVDGTFTVFLDGGKIADTDIEVLYTVGGTATAGLDYTALSGSVTILAGTSSATITVPVIDDGIVDPGIVGAPSETVVVTLSTSSAAAIGAPIAVAPDNEATIDIVDEDFTFVSISGTAGGVGGLGTDGLEGAVSPDGSFVVTLSLPSSTDTVITYAVGGTANTTLTGTPSDPADHSLLDGTVTILAGATTATIVVPVLDSDLIEEDETVIVSLISQVSGNPVLGGATSDSILIGDDDKGVVDVDATINPASEPASDGAFTFYLNKPGGFPSLDPVVSDRDTVINYTVTGTATGGADYVALSGVATIPAFASSVTIPVSIINDVLLEGTETVIVTIDSLSAPTDSNITIGTGSPSDTLFITDDDGVVIDVVGTDGAEPGTPGTLTFKQTGGTTLTPTVVTYSVTGGTAVQGVDYGVLSGTVTIPAGPSGTSATVSVPVIDDGLFEGTESVAVTITGATGGPGLSISGVPGTLNILDNETGIAAVVATADAAEAKTDGAFLFTLGGASPLPTTVTYSVAGTATAGSDYTALTGTVFFGPFITSVAVPVSVINDGFSEIPETVEVTVTGIASGIGYTPSATPATVTIHSDQEVSIVATDPTAGEPGDDGLFTVSLSTPGFGATVSDVPTVIAYSVSGTATNGTDYATLSGLVTIPAMSSSATIPVSVLDDSTLESTEHVIVTLTSITSGEGDITIGAADSDMLSITDDDAAYVTVAPKPKGFDNPGSTTDTGFIVTMSDPSDADTVVFYSVLGSSTATSGSDYAALSGSVTIPAGSTSAMIVVDVTDDIEVEGDETVSIELTSVTNAGAHPVFLGAIGGPVVTFQQGAGGYLGTSDVFISQLTPAVNHDGSGVAVNTDTLIGPSTAAEHGLVKFDGIFGPGAIPLGSTIADATLSLWVPFSFPSAGGGIVLHQMLADWSESLNWATSTGIGNFVAGLQPGTADAEVGGVPFSLVGAGFLAPPVKNDITVTGTVQDWSLGDANFGWGFLPTDAAAGTFFLDSENGTVGFRPLLEVTLDMTATALICDTDTAVVNIVGSSPAIEPGVPGTITVALSAPSHLPTVVTYVDTFTGTATNVSDYVPLTGTVTIPAGSLTADIVVTPMDDSLVESTETVNVMLTGISSGDPEISLGAAVSGGTIIIDTDSTSVTIAGTADAFENTPGTPGLPPIDGAFTVSLSTPSDVPTVVTYVFGGTATNGVDYTTLSGTVTVPAFFLTATIPIDVIDDLINEAPIEVISLSLTGATGNPLTFLGAPSSATIDLYDDEQPLEASVSATVDPAVEGASDGVLTITLNHPSDAATVITYSVGGTATGAVGTGSPDYDVTQFPGITAPGYSVGTITLGPGVTSATFPVDVLQDFAPEGPESVDLTITSISNPNGAGIGTATDTVTIVDEVFLVSVVTNFSPAAEPGPPTGNNGQFTFTLNNPLPEDTTIVYSIGGTATPSGGILPADYTALTGTATIVAGATSTTVTVPVIDDLTVEGSETVIVTLASATSSGPSYIFGAPSIGVSATPATETILDNDSAELTITKTSDGTEPGGAINDGLFTITQSAVSSTATLVTYSVQAASTAGAGDYVLVGTGTATIAAGATSTTITVDVTNDGIVEGDETVVVKLDAVLPASDPQITIGATDTATVIISDDDMAVVSVTATDFIGFEPGTNDGLFTVSLSAPSSTATVVSFTIGGDATPGSDYAAIVGPVTIPAGSTSVGVAVDVLDDMILEDLETVVMSLTGIVSGDPQITHSPAPATVFITPDNDMATVTITGTTNGDEGPPTDGVFTVSISKLSDVPTVFTYTVGGTATSGSDYTPLALTGTIPALSTSTTIVVPVIDDSTDEATETVTVTLTGFTAGHFPATSLGAPSSATIDIIDDDTPAIVLSVVADSLAEGNPGDDQTFLITASLTQPYDIATTWTVSLADVTTGAYGGADYFPATGLTITFPAGSTLPSGLGSVGTPIEVDVIEDLLVELDETFTATATVGVLPAGYSGIGDSLTLTIENDDTAVFTVNNAGPYESTGSLSGPFTPMILTVSSSRDIDAAVVIDVDFADITAVGGDFDSFFPLPGSVPSTIDYDNDPDNSSSLLTFGLGTLSLPLTVLVNPDGIVEGGAGLVGGFGDERFRVLLSDASGTRSTDTTDLGTGVIRDDDSATVSIATGLSPAMEPGTDGSFILTQTAVSSTNTVVAYSISGSADNGVDYATLSGTATILAGDTTATILVDVLNNPILEDDETVTLTLTSITSSDPNVTLAGPSTATVVIFDDDDATVKIEATDASASEDPLDDGEFTFTLSEVSDTDTVVFYSIATGVGQATNGSDYAALSGSVTIPAGSTTATVLVDVLDDVLVEGAETVTLTITGFGPPTHPNILPDAMSSDTVTIADDIDGILVNVVANGDGSEPENNGSFKITLTKSDGVTPVPAPATGAFITYMVGGTATPGTGGDYAALSGVLFIAPGATMGTIDIDVEDDTLLETTETVVLTLVGVPTSFPSALPGGPEPVSIGIASDTVLIIDNEVATFTIDDVTVNEGDGTGFFTITLDTTLPFGIPPIPITVSTLFGNAVLGSDYTYGPPGTETVTFVGGDVAGTPKTVPFLLIDDAIPEGTEAFVVGMTTPTLTPGGYNVVVSGLGSATIIDNDGLAFQVTDVKVTSGSWTADFKDVVDGNVVGSGLGTGYSIPTGSTAQTKSLPWSDIDQLIVTFTETIDPLTVAGSVVLHTTLAGPTISGVTPVGNTLVIDLSASLTTNTFRLEILDTLKSTSGNDLDGDFVNTVETLNSGGPAPLGDPLNDFNFHFAVNQGDTDQSGVVNVADAMPIFTYFFGTIGTPGYSVFADVTGDGILTIADATVVFGNFFAVTPVGFPGTLFGSGGGGFAGAVTPEVGDAPAADDTASKSASTLSEAPAADSNSVGQEDDDEIWSDDDLSALDDVLLETLEVL